MRQGVSVKSLEQSAHDAMPGLQLLAALAGRGRTLAEIRRVLDDDDALDALAAEVKRLATVDDQRLAALGTIDPKTPEVRFRDLLRCASWPGQYREGEPLAVGLLACGNAEFVGSAINSLTTTTQGPWRRAALCLRFGLGGNEPIEDHDLIASLVGRESVSGWLGPVSNNYSFATMLTHLLVEREIPSLPTTLWELPIEALSLSIRATRLVRSSGIELVGDFKGYTPDSLREKWPKSEGGPVKEVATALRSRGVWS